MSLGLLLLVRFYVVCTVQSQKYHWSTQLFAALYGLKNALSSESLCVLSNLPLVVTLISDWAKMNYFDILMTNLKHKFNNYLLKWKHEALRYLEASYPITCVLPF